MIWGWIIAAISVAGSAYYQKKMMEDMAEKNSGFLIILLPRQYNMSHVSFISLVRITVNLSLKAIFNNAPVVILL